MQHTATMDTVTMVAIGVLATVFVGSLVTLIIVCRRKYCKRLDLISRQHQENSPDVNLVENMEGPIENVSGVELDAVTLTPNLDEILNNEDWVNDATGLAPHTLAILKTCHLLTEKLVCMTMSNAQQLRSPGALDDLVTIAKRIGPRVDDVVRSMYPPLDARLLEARCTALVLQVCHLVLVVKNICRLSGVLDWIDQSLADVEDHLKVLRDASNAYETSCRPITPEPTTSNQSNNPPSPHTQANSNSLHTQASSNSMHSQASSTHGHSEPSSAAVTSSQTNESSEV